MDPVLEELSQLLDREKIRNCIAYLARGEDRRDATLISASCWPDSHSNYGVFEGNFDEYLAWVVPGSEAIENTQHVLGQTVIELDGDSALAETQVISYHRVDMVEDERDICIGGRYLDRLEKRDGEWRIADRLMLYDWCQDWGQSVDWEQGLMGQSLSAEYFAGRAVGDHSEIFFDRK